MDKVHTITQLNRATVHEIPGLSLRVAVRHGRTTPLRNPFNPFLKSFLIYGMDLEGNYNSPSFKSMLFKCWTILVALYYHYCLAFEIVWYFRYRMQENVLAESISVWSSVLTFDILLWKKSDINRFMGVVKSETSRFCRHVRKRQEKSILVVCCFVWLFTVVFICLHIVLSTRDEYEKRHVITPLSFFSSYVKEPHRLAKFKLDTCVECFFIHGLLSWSMTLYLLLCWNAISWFKNLGDFICSGRYPATRWKYADIRQFFQAFDDLSQKVRLLDNVFSKSVAVWLSAIVMLLCIRIVTIVSPRLEITSQMLALTFMTFSRAAITLVGMSFLADALHKEAKKTLFCVDKLLRENKIILNDSVYQEIHMAYTRFSLNPTYLTLCRITRLNRRFLMTSIGVMATYVIISIQMYPNTTNG